MVIQNFHNHNNYCSSCGGKHEQTQSKKEPIVHYCPNCGTKLMTDLNGKQEVEITCSNCQKKLLTTFERTVQIGTYCSCCGNKYTSPQAVLPPDQPGSYGFVVLLIIAAILIYIFRDADWIQNILH